MTEHKPDRCIAIMAAKTALWSSLSDEVRTALVDYSEALMVDDGMPVHATLFPDDDAAEIRFRGASREYSDWLLKKQLDAAAKFACEPLPREHFALTGPGW